MVKYRYDYETSMLTALSIAGAKVKDHAVPAHYQPREINDQVTAYGTKELARSLVWILETYLLQVCIVWLPPNRHLSLRPACSYL